MEGQLNKKEKKQTVVEQIIGEKPKIKFIKRGLDDKRYGSGHTAEYRMYNLEVKNPSTGEPWLTTLTVYNSIEPIQDIEKTPRLPIIIDITTGHGEMPLTTDQEKINLVYKEIMRQIDTDMDN